MLALLSNLDTWSSLPDLQSAFPLVEGAHLDDLVTWGIVECDDVVPSGVEPTYWNPFDLVVQRNSSVGGYDGGAVHARGLPPPPLFKCRPPGAVLSLPPPTAVIDDKLSDVLARRRSIRTYAAHSIDISELSTLLYHSVRVTATQTSEELGGHAFHPYASGGARSELELYVVANSVNGLERGAHYYDARCHELVSMGASNEGQSRLNRYVRRATNDSLNRDPDVLVIVTAVFARIMWKYSGIGLGIIYRDTGCLYQTMYLVATAIGLAPCGVGGGEEVENSRWLGLDPLVESQVGCMLIGTVGVARSPVPGGAVGDVVSAS